MSKEYTLSFYHDCRRKKGNDAFPLKLRIYHTPSRKEKLFRTGYDLSEAEFNQAIKNLPPEKSNLRISKDRRKEISEIALFLKSKADQVLKEMSCFSFESFECRYYNKSARLDVINYYESIMERQKNEGRIRNVESYFNSLNKLKQFLNRNRKNPIQEIPFDAITPKTLKEFEDYYTYLGRTRATIGIYLRPLRAVFNQALADPNSGLHTSTYPFGKSKYQIPTGKNTKRALSNHQLKTLFKSSPKNEFQEKAKAFWFFSYLAQGMNMKDIALLTFNNIADNRIFFYRAKTQRTTKDNPILIQVSLHDYLKEVIIKYGVNENRKDDFVFKIISKSDSPLVQSNKIKAFTRFVNQHIKLLATENGLPGEISTYWARHSYTTKLVNEGNPLALIQQSLGHKSINTTQNYIAGFPASQLKRVSESLLQFD